jgi:hypothetical protein
VELSTKPPTSADSNHTAWLAPAALLTIAIISLAPLIVAQRPIHLFGPDSPVVEHAGKVAVIGLMLAAVAIGAWSCSKNEPHPVLLAVGMLVLSGILTTWHFVVVESRRDVDPRGGAEGTHYIYTLDWQRNLYLMILNRDRGDPNGISSIPHVFRPLPYGFTRSLEWCTGDWLFACLVYRWFFTFWFLWGYYQFARLFHAPARALLTLVPYLLLYPLSILYYGGQLTDPLSHALFALSLILIIQDRWLALAGALFLGVMAKETILIMVIVYLACYWRAGAVFWLKAIFLGLTCALAYLAVRLPVGWAPDYRSINGTDALMISSNLGLPSAPYRLIHGMLLRNYLHPCLFIGAFLPFVLARWRRTDPRLKAMLLTLIPLLLASNISFGWLYESRNYVPALPVLATIAVGPTAGKPRS